MNCYTRYKDIKGSVGNILWNMNEVFPVHCVEIMMVNLSRRTVSLYDEIIASYSPDPNNEMDPVFHFNLDNRMVQALEYDIKSSMGNADFNYRENNNDFERAKKEKRSNSTSTCS